MADATVAKLEDIGVLAPDGSPVRLGEQWREKPVILAMIRHFIVVCANAETFGGCSTVAGPHPNNPTTATAISARRTSILPA